MKIFLVIFLAIFLMSCRNSNQLGSTTTLALNTNAFAENRVDFKSERQFYQLALHLIFLHQTNIAEFSHVKSQNILKGKNPFLRIENLDLKNKFAELIVTSVNGDQLFYVPINSNKEILLKSLNITKDDDKEFIWINSTLHLGETSVLAITNKKEILLNERNFESKELTFDDIDEVHLDKMGSYQIIKIRSKLKISEPDERTYLEYYTESRPRERRDVECNYHINRPLNTYSKFEYNEDLKIQYKLKFGEQSKNLEGNEIEIDLKEELKPTNVDLIYNKYLEYNKVITGERIAAYCESTYSEKILVKKKLNYDVSIRILGSNKSEDDLWELPQDLNEF